MVIEPKGQWEHNAYQSDTQFVLEVKPIVADPARAAAQRGRYTGDRLSLNFQNVEVRAVLNVIADFTDLNIITSDTVTGNITLRLKDVPWDQALEIILQTRGLDSRRSGNVIWIAPRDELATREKLAARGGESDQRPGADAHRVVPDELPEGGGRAEAPVRPDAAHPVQARQRGGRRAHQHALRAGHAEPPRGRAPPDRPHRRRGAPGDDRGAHRRGERQLQPQPRRAARPERHPGERPPRPRSEQPALPRGCKHRR